MSPPPLQIAVYISGHGYGHFTRTLNLLSLLSRTAKYTFHIRTSSSLCAVPLPYALHPGVIQTNPYQIDTDQSLHSLQNFDPSYPQTEESRFLKQYNIQAIISDAVSLPCLLANSLNIPAILITNFTFDSIFQTLLDTAPKNTNKTSCQLKVDEMTRQYALADAILRLPGYIPFIFNGPQIIDVPMHFRRAIRNRTETFLALGLQHLEGQKVLLHCFGGHGLDAPSELPKLPEGWVCLSQTIHHPPFFYKILGDVYMPDVIGACDAILGKLGWGTCSEVIGNGYKPFIYVPRSAFVEEVGLLSWMQSAHRKIVRLEVDKYESNIWLEAIEEAQKMIPIQSSESKDDWVKKEDDLVRIFGDTLETALENRCERRMAGLQ